jgi:hypothetical protein
MTCERHHDEITLAGRVDASRAIHPRRSVAGSPRSTNAWRAYEWASGTKVDDESESAGLVGSLAAVVLPLRKQKNVPLRVSVTSPWL